MSEQEAAAEGASAGSGESRGPMIIAAVNTVVVLAAIGALVYTRILFKRPPITENGERDRLAKMVAKPAVPVVSALINFEPVTVNIQATPEIPKSADGTSLQIKGKMHYVNLGFTMEIQDDRRKDEVEALRPIIMDRLLSILGHKTYQELTNVQGRYLLRSQIIDSTNEIVNGKRPGEPPKEKEGENSEPTVIKPPVVTNVFFTSFLVQ